MENAPQESRHDVETRYYLNVNKWANQRLESIDPNLTARVVSTEQEPGLQDVTLINERKKVLLITSATDSYMEWTMHIPYDPEKLESYFEAFEKDYKEYLSENAEQ